VIKTARIPLALGAFFVVAALLAACGGGIPGNSVARVDDTTIKKAEFDHWIGVAAKSSQQQGAPAANTTVPDAPNFTKCIAAARAQVPKPAKGQPAPTVKQLKAQCLQQFNGLRDQVMQFLINAQWLKGEAADQNIKVTDAEITKSFNQQKQQQFPKAADYQKFLKSSGMTEADLRYNVELTLLSNKLRTKVTKGKDKATPAQISAFYAKNRKQFAKPQTRDANLVLTKTQAQANAAKKALAGGDSWATVAKKYSTDPQTKQNGGKLPGITQGQQDPAFDKAVFAAKKGQVTGPIKTQFGYLVFDVTNSTPASQQTLAQAAPQIRQQLSTQGQQKALQSFVKDFEKKWKDRTDCRKGFVVDVCKNAPKKKAQTTTAPPGAVPQQGGASQQQQQPPASEQPTQTTQK
jgi:foldase protein PrsA